MTTLFNRKYSIQIGGIDVTHLDCKFSIKRHLRRSANECTLEVSNLKRGSIQKLERAEEIFIKIEAGYVDDQGLTLLFKGSTKKGIQVRADGQGHTVTVTAKDGRRINNNTIRRSYDKQTSLQKVLEDLAEAMGVGTGNLSNFKNDALTATNTKNFPEGYVASGKAWVKFDSIVRRMGLRWSVQNGNIFLIKQKRTKFVAANLLNSNTGLLGSPSKDKVGKVNCTVLIQPGVEPGKLVKLESKFIEGTYEIQETRYEGETWGTNSKWDANLVLKPLRSS